MDTANEPGSAEALPEPEVQIGEVEPGRCQHHWVGIDDGCICLSCGQFHGEVLIPIRKISEWTIGGPVKRYRQTIKPFGADEEDAGR